MTMQWPWEDAEEYFREEGRDHVRWMVDEVEACMRGWRLGIIGDNELKEATLEYGTHIHLAKPSGLHSKDDFIRREAEELCRRSAIAFYLSEAIGIAIVDLRSPNALKHSFRTVAEFPEDCSREFVLRHSWKYMQRHFREEKDIDVIEDIPLPPCPPFIDQLDH